MTFDLTELTGLAEFTGLTVLAVRLEGTVLRIDLADDWFLTVENDYSFGALRSASGDEPEMVERLASAVGSTLASFACTSDGHLTVGIAGGELTVSPDPHHESWGLVGPNQQRVVCTPGGPLAVWS